MAEGPWGPPLGPLGLMLVAPVGGSNGVSRGSEGTSTSFGISKLLISRAAQANSSPVRSAKFLKCIQALE